MSVSQILTLRLDLPLFVHSTKVSELHPGPYIAALHGDPICYGFSSCTEKPLDASGTNSKHPVLESTVNSYKVGTCALDGSQLWPTAQSTGCPTVLVPWVKGGASINQDALPCSFPMQAPFTTRIETT